MGKKKVSKALSTKIVKLDVDVILRNYTKPEFWKKEWLIFKSDIISLYAKINVIDIKRNIIQMRIYCDEWIRCKKLKKRVLISNYDKEIYLDIPINHDDYSKEKFTSDLLKKCLQVIKAIEQTMIRDYREYNEAKQLESDYEDRLREIAEEYLDDCGVRQDDIRDAYIDSYIWHCDVPNYTSDVIYNFQYTVIPHEYLLITSFFGNKELYDDYSAKTKKLRKSTRIKLWLDGQKLNDDEFIEEMKDELMPI